MFQRFVLCSIGVSDLEKAIEFYRDVLGFKLVIIIPFQGQEADRALQIGDRNTEFRVALLERDGQRLELIHFTRPSMRRPQAPPAINDIGLSHFAFQCEDADAVVKELRKRGIEVKEGQSGRLIPERHEKVFVFRGFDGVICEVLQYQKNKKTPFD